MKHSAESRNTGRRLLDKVVLLYFGENRQGLSLATDLAREGADIALVYTHPGHERVSRARREVEALGRRCLSIHTDDSGSRGDSRAVVARIAHTLGRLDIFIDQSRPPVDQPSGYAPDQASNGHGKQIILNFQILLASLSHFALANE